MVVERFVPQEYITACWYVKQSDMFTTLYHDRLTTTITDYFLFIPIGTHPEYGWYDTGEDVSLPTQARIPGEGNNFKVSVPTPINTTGDGNKYYTEKTHDSVENRDKYVLSSNVSTLYSYEYNGIKYYFKIPTVLTGNSSA